MIPPPPALPGFPNDAPSELSLNQPSLGLFQPTGITTFALVYLLLCKLRMLYYIPHKLLFISRIFKEE